MSDWIVNEIIKRVDENDIPLEDGEFTIDGRVYSTKEVEGDWHCCYFGVSFDTFERDTICEIFEGDEPLNIFIHQKQLKRVYPKEVKRVYIYNKCTQVKRTIEVPVCSGWVKA